MKATTRSADGIPVHYETHGEGSPALVFVHGWSCDRSYWNAQLSHFADRHQVVTIDLAGHGESGMGREAWTMPAFGEDVVAVFDELDLADAVLIGHSMGGDVIIEAALRRPDRVVALVWVDVYTNLEHTGTEQADLDVFAEPFREDFVAATQRFVRQMFPPGTDPELVDLIAGDMSCAPAQVALESLGYSFTNLPAVLRALERLPIPVIAINPDSRSTDIDSFRRHGVRVVLMHGVGHFAMMEEPDAFNKCLSEVLANCL